FPWRRLRTGAFHLLVAELLLAQTKAEDVAKVWPQLINRYPRPAQLSRARLRTLAGLLRPLGFQNQRSKALKKIAAFLEKECNGKVPRSAEALLQVPHIGLYAATAVACFKFRQR